MSLSRLFRSSGLIRTTTGTPSRPPDDPHGSLLVGEMGPGRAHDVAVEVAVQLVDIDGAIRVSVGVSLDPLNEQ